MIACLSDLGLEVYLLEPRRSDVADHVAHCANCAARLEEMRRDGDAFEREVYPATVGAVVRAGGSAGRLRPPRRRWLMLTLPLAAAAILVAFVAIRVRHPAAAHDFVLNDSSRFVIT